MIYVALSALFVAVLLLAAYVRVLYVRLAHQRKMNDTTTSLLMILHQRATLTEANVRELRDLSVLSAAQSAGIDPMRN